MKLRAGDKVNVQYDSYSIEATVMCTPTGDGWVDVRQDTHYEGEPEEHRPTFPAAVEYVTPAGDPPAMRPSQRIMATLAGLVR